MLTDEANCPETSAVLFAGGCHVAGFHAGIEESFPAFCEASLARSGLEIAVHRLAHLKLPHRRRLVATCREVAPRLLVLQLGHAELNRQLSDYMKSKLGRPLHVNHNSDAVSLPTFVGSASLFYMRSILKAAVDACLGHPLVDFPRLASLLNQLLFDLAKADNPAVLLMSPMPCADLTLMHYRRRALPLFREIAAEHRCGFADLLALAPTGMQKRLGAAEFYYDAIHLGRLGQRAVGEALSIHVRRLLTISSGSPCSL